MRSEEEMPPELLAPPEASAKGLPFLDLGGYPDGELRVIAVRDGTLLAARFARGERPDA